MASEINKLEKAEDQTGYRIGAVSSLTGISPDTLRIWEKRYSVVQPYRTDTGNRVYSKQDLIQLSLIKHLIDAGDNIGTLAELDIPTLRARTETLQSAGLKSEALAQRPCRVVVVGSNMAMRIAEAVDDLQGLEVAGACATTEEIDELTLEENPDVVIFELPTLDDSHIEKLTQWQERLNAPYALVVYRFSSERVLQRINTTHCIALRAPVEMTTLRRHCEAILHQLLNESREVTLEFPIMSDTIPPRLYDDNTLARIANISTALKCECPHHLAELTMGLNAFETYSAKCENQTREDAALHAYLHSATAQARQIIEQALEHLIEVEKINV